MKIIFISYLLIKNYDAITDSLLYGDSECFTQTDNQLIQDQRCLCAFEIRNDIESYLKEKGFHTL